MVEKAGVAPLVFSLHRHYMTGGEKSKMMEMLEKLGFSETGLKLIAGALVFYVVMDLLGRYMVHRANKYAEKKGAEQ